MINKHSSTSCPETERYFLSRINLRDIPTAHVTCSCVEINVMHHGIGGRIFQSKLHKIILMNYNKWSWYRSIKGERPYGVSGGYFHFHFLYFQRYFYYFGTALGNLIVNRSKRRHNHFLFDALQIIPFTFKRRVHY